MGQKAPKGHEHSTASTHPPRAKSHFKIADEQQSIEEIFAQTGSYTVHQEDPRRLVIFTCFCCTVLITWIIVKKK